MPVEALECPKCGASVSKYGDRCPYCGTHYIVKGEKTHSREVEFSDLPTADAIIDELMEICKRGYVTPGIIRKTLKKHEPGIQWGQKETANKVSQYAALDRNDINVSVRSGIGTAVPIVYSFRKKKETSR